MSDFKAKKEVAIEILSQFVCSSCQDVPGPTGVRKNRYACQNGHLVCENCKFGECSCKSKVFIGPMQHVEKILETLQVNLCQKLLHQLTHNMSTDCSLNHKFKYMKFPSSEHGESMLFTEIVSDIQNNLCKQQLLQKEELLTKIYLYSGTIVAISNLDAGMSLRQNVLMNIRNFVFTVKSFVPNGVARRRFCSKILLITLELIIRIGRLWQQKRMKKHFL